jgi:hypothetical protein
MDDMSFSYNWLNGEEISSAILQKYCIEIKAAKQKLMVEYRWIKNGRGIIYQIPDQTTKDAAVKAESNQYFSAGTKMNVGKINCRF